LFCFVGWFVARWVDAWIVCSVWLLGLYQFFAWWMFNVAICWMVMGLIGWLANSLLCIDRLICGWSIVCLLVACLVDERIVGFVLFA